MTDDEWEGRSRLSAEQRLAYDAMMTATTAMRNAIVEFAQWLPTGDRHLDRDRIEEDIDRGAGICERVGWASLDTARRMREFKASFPGLLP